MNAATPYVLRGLAATLMLGAVACSAIDDSDAVGAGDIIGDGKADVVDLGETDDAPRVCTIGASYSEVTNAEVWSPEGSDFYYLTGDVSSKPLTRLEISLWDGAPGVFDLAAEPTSFANCKLCITLVSPDDAYRTFFAQSGTAEITKLNETMEGTLSDIVLQEIDLETSELIEGGCTTSIPSLTFSAAFEIADPLGPRG